MSASEKDRVEEFTEFRQRMNERILGQDNQVVRRFFALDTQTYKAGKLDLKTKELLGLVASMVLRCDDCISYHIAQCKEAGVDRDEIGALIFPDLGACRSACPDLAADAHPARTRGYDGRPRTSARARAGAARPRRAARAGVAGRRGAHL